MELQAPYHTKVEKSIRDRILEFESGMAQIPGAFAGDTENCPLTHRFSDGIYVREIFIPKGMLLTGKIHKHQHPNFLMSGRLSIFTEQNGEEILEAPLVVISEPGTKRVIYAHEDSVLVTVHKNLSNTQDLEQLEQDNIAKDYEEFEQLKKQIP